MVCGACLSVANLIDSAGSEKLSRPYRCSSKVDHLRSRLSRSCLAGFSLPTVSVRFQILRHPNATVCFAEAEDRFIDQNDTAVMIFHGFSSQVINHVCFNISPSSVFELTSTFGTVAARVIDLVAKRMGGMTATVFPLAVFWKIERQSGDQRPPDLLPAER